MSRREFSYKAEAGQRTETERVECYPISADAPRGDYEVAIGIDSEPMPRIYFATDAPMKDGYYTVGKITLERK